MKIVILTNKRKPEYIHQCIREIRRDYKGKIDLMISGKETDYLEKYKGEGFVWHRNNEKGLINGWNKACQGYANCVRLGKGEGVLVIEDDTGFKKGWYKQFLTYLTFVKDKKFIVSLGKALDGSVVNPNGVPNENTYDEKDNAYHEFIPSLQIFLYRVNLKAEEKGKPPTAFIITWLDSHAVYYPPTLDLEDLAQFIEKFGVQGNSMHDILIGYYLFRKVYPIWIASPPLAVNTGAYNTSVGPIIDRNDDFLDWDYDKA